MVHVVCSGKYSVTECAVATRQHYHHRGTKRELFGVRSSKLATEKYHAEDAGDEAKQKDEKNQSG
jgi:hypothetical protein